MNFGETLTLKEAAKFAGVSEGTMRTWSKEIQNIKRLPGGGYEIPRAGLQAYLSLKHARPVKGATISSVAATKVKTKGSNEGALVARLEAENSRLLQEATIRGAELQGVREELKEAQSQIRKLEAEMRAYLTGNGITSALARIFRK